MKKNYQPLAKQLKNIGENQVQENNEFNEWAIIELFGHQKMAGHVTNASIGGASFIRVDVPQVGEGQKYIPAFTRFLGASSIYAINPVSETVARAAACSYRSAPVHAFDIPELRQHSLALENQDRRPFDQDFEDDDEREMQDQIVENPFDDIPL